MVPLILLQQLCSNKVSPTSPVLTSSVTLFQNNSNQIKQNELLVQQNSLYVEELKIMLR
jgi:outer membrane protein